MERIGIICLILCLACGLALAEAGTAYEDYGRVLEAEKTDAGVRITAEGLFGYHMDQNPNVTLTVGLDAAGTITDIALVSMKDQTPGFGEKVTGEYLEKAYVGRPATTAMEADAVSGATLTSQAALYAVRTAAWYAQGMGISADTGSADMEELGAVYPARYLPMEISYQPDEKKIGQILYAAEGTAQDGTQVIALKVKGAAKFSYKGSASTGWSSSEPNPFTMVIVIDRNTDSVIAWKILVDGTNQPEYFKVPDEKIDQYKTVVIDREDVFDEFMDGIVLTMEFEKVSSEDGPMITGTSIVYTGKTKQGTFSSQIVRNCFRAAARFYINALK